MSDMRILIIEDDREAAAYLAKAFRETGHNPDQALDGLDGYAMARDGNYDVLVVDRMLPKLDGLSLIRSLRDEGIAILLSEQNARAALGIADRGYVIVHGDIAFEGGSAAELSNNELIRQFYMGDVAS